MYDCADPASRAEGLKAAALALRTGELVVLPTDTVYGIGADAFYPSAVMALLAAKGRARDMPPPVLVGTVRAASALIEDLGPYGQDLIDEFWPGGLTIVCRANRSLNWDLGDTRGTVAIRMPLHPVTLELLKETGPLAVSSANISGHPTCRSGIEVFGMMDGRVDLVIDGGACSGAGATTVDVTEPVWKLIKQGAITEKEIAECLQSL